MTRRQLAHHHEPPNPCPICEAVLTELAQSREDIANLLTDLAEWRLYARNVVVERDTARAEVAGLFDSPPMVRRCQECS